MYGTSSREISFPSKAEGCSPRGMLLLTDHVDRPEQALGDDRVHLAHVGSGVRRVHPLDVEGPRSIPVERDVDSRVPRDHVVLHRQDGRLVVSDPGDLRGNGCGLMTLREMGVKGEWMGGRRLGGR